MVGQEVRDLCLAFLIDIQPDGGDVMVCLEIAIDRSWEQAESLLDQLHAPVLRTPRFVVIAGHRCV